MSESPAAPRVRSDRGLVPGVVLIVVGVSLLAAQVLDVGREIIPAVVGAAFLVLYALTRRYGFLVPAGILIGAGFGIAAGARYDLGNWIIPLAVGLGFVSVYVIDRLVSGESARWWPLIPGGITIVVGMVLAGRQLAPLEPVVRWWPLLLIGLGAWLLLRRR